MTRVLVEDVTAASAASAEQNADLAALQLAAGAEPVPVDPNAPPEPLPVDLAGEISSVLLMVTQILRPALPSVADLYTAETAGAVGQAVAGVCLKHGWLQNGMMGQWGEEIACAAVVLPLGFATVKAAQSDLVELKRKAAERDKPAGAPAQIGQAEPAQAFGFGAKSVQFGNVAPA